jgi:hypothetical protein
MVSELVIAEPLMVSPVARLTRARTAMMLIRQLANGPEEKSPSEPRERRQALIKTVMSLMRAQADTCECNEKVIPECPNGGFPRRQALLSSKTIAA